MGAGGRFGIIRTIYLMFSKRPVPKPVRTAPLNLWAWLGLGVLAVLLLGNITYAFIDLGDINADLFVWTAFFRDWTTPGFEWAKWTLPPSGYLFPDLPLCVLLGYLFNGQTVLMLWAQYIIYAGLWVAGTGLLLRRYLGWGRWESAYAAFFVALCITHPLIIPRAIMTGMIVPAAHGQTAFMVLWAAVALHDVWQKPRSRALGWLLGLTFLGALGDRIFAVWWVIPAVAVACVGRRWRLAGLILAAGVAGSALAWAVTPANTLLYTPTGTWRVIKESQLPSGWPVFINDFHIFAKYQPAMCALLLIGALAGGWALWRRRQSLPWWTAGLLLMIFLPWVLSLVLDIYDGAENWRHFPFAVFFSLIGFWGLCRRFVKAGRTLCLGAVAGLSVHILLVACVTPRQEIAYPSFVEDFDNAKELLQLKDGLASYWFCKQTNLLSRKGTFLAPIWKDGRPNPVLTTLRDFENKDFNYIIVDILWQPKILAYYGPPQRAVKLQNDAVKNGWTIFIYPPGVLNKRLAEDPGLGQLAAQRNVKLQIVDSK